MRLIYLDEAGVSNPKHEPYLVVAGVIVDGDRQWKAIEGRLREIVGEYIPEEDRRGFVLHATELFPGGKYFDRNIWPKSKRWEILDALVNVIPTHNLPVVHGLVDRERCYSNIEKYVPGHN